MATLLPDNIGSVICNISHNWHGFSAIKHLVVFGASYCAVREQSYKTEFLHPMPGQPLGIEFPGQTYAEPGKPNWVGHLVTKHAPHSEMLAYSYAIGGAMVDGVKSQIRDVFPLEVGKILKSEWAPQHWDPVNTLFVIWVGINDCAFKCDVQDKMLALLNAWEHLYNAGARNFLFVDLPPMHRSPSALARFRENLNSIPTTLDAPKAVPTLMNWNQELRRYVSLFANSHVKEVTAMIYSSFDTFNRVLDDPESHGFVKGDVEKRGGIWDDAIHPTSAMHEIIAKDIALLLVGQPAFSGECKGYVACG